MRTWDSPLRSIRSAAFLAGAAAVLLSANTVLNDFAFDDLPIIIANTPIQDLATLPEAVISPYWPNEYGKDLGLWRPMATAAYGLQWAVWGENPAMFHVVNVLLHGLVTALVVLVLAEIAFFSGRLPRLSPGRAANLASARRGHHASVRSRLPHERERHHAPRGSLSPGRSAGQCRSQGGALLRSAAVGDLFEPDCCSWAHSDRAVRRTRKRGQPVGPVGCCAPAG